MDKGNNLLSGWNLVESAVESRRFDKKSKVGYSCISGRELMLGENLVIKKTWRLW